MTDLAYGTNPGCVARVSHGGSPRQCGCEEAAAVPHRFRGPGRPHVTRLYVCQAHADDVDGAEPLTDADRRTIAERHGRRRAVLERAGRLDLIGE